jgi:hypothetical protein
MGLLGTPCKARRSRREARGEFKRRSRDPGNQGPRLEELCRYLLPKKRPCPSTRLPPENRARRGPHSGLFFGPGALAHPGNVDAFQGARDLRASAPIGSLHDPLHGRHSPSQKPWSTAHAPRRRPDQPVAELLAHLGLALPTSPKIIENVVEKIA